MAGSEIRILLVQNALRDLTLTQELLDEALPGVAFTLEIAVGLEAGIERAGRQLFDAGLLNLDRIAGGEMETLRSFREAVPQLPVVILCAPGDRECRDGAVRHGAQDCLAAGEVTPGSLARALYHAVERNRMEQAAKMVAIGRLAGGVAHDFNNLLMVISGYNDIIATRVDDDGLVGESSEQIRKAVKRAATLTTQLLSFSRKKLLRPVLVDLNRVIHEATSMLMPIVGNQIRLAFDLEPGLAPTTADPTQLEQALVNLAENARDAMPQGGALTVSTERAGGYVVLRFSDTGCGMDAETLSHVFEPFYTTKRHGGLTGLGLSTVYGIVEQCGGEIRVESTPGRGTIFSLYFPAAEVAAEGSGVREGAGAAARGSERLLVVDDEPEVVTVLKEALVSGGYLVATATRRENALELFVSPEERFDMVLVDVVMPGMGVADFIRELRRAKPQAKVALISGYSGGGEEVTALAKTADLFLSKPIERPKLLRELRRVLDVG